MLEKCILHVISYIRLADRRNLHFAVECSKSVHFKDSYCMCEFLVPTAQVMPRTIRSGQQYVMSIPRYRTNMGQKAYSYRSLFFWNSLHSDLCAIEDVVAFKSAV